MFSPATRKSPLASQRDRNPGRPAAGDDSPTTPLVVSHRSPPGAAVPNRPSTGTPAPWNSRLSVLARISSVKKTERGADADQIQPVYVGEFPQAVRNAQANLLQKSSTGDSLHSGGMDRGTFLCWMICGNQLFVWSYLSAEVSKKCVALEIPSALGNGDIGMKSRHANPWMVFVVRWDALSTSSEKVLGTCNSVGIVICNKKSQDVLYWPNIYSESGNAPIVSLRNPLESDLQGDGRNNDLGNEEVSEYEWFNSIIVSAIPGSFHDCILLACQSNGDVWHFHLAQSGITRKKIDRNTLDDNTAGTSRLNKGYARSLIWRLHDINAEESDRQFLLLTDRGIQCWNVKLESLINVTRLWTHELVSDDIDWGIKKDLAGQKHIWLLDMQVDDRGKEFTILVATLCKDRVSSSSYTQYSLLTMQFRPGQSFASENNGTKNRVLEKKAPLQVIIPKARVEDEDFLFSMKLCVGGKPPGSVIILSADGTATVANYWRGSTRLYQFDLPWDAGKVLDASVFPSSEDSKEGAWVVLTEKAGVWAIPEKAVLLGGVEPPERSLSRKGSSNEGAAEEEKRSQAFGSNIVPRRASSEAWSAADRQKVALTGIAQRTAQDEEAESLLGHLFHDFLLSGKVEGALEKLKNKGAFEKEGETNIFARLSKSVVDTLAKHWTTTRGAEFVSSAVVSSLLLDKQQKHKRYLQFLALSKCHEELSSRQRHSLLLIMEHGEKLSGMIQIRELQHLVSQHRSAEAGTPPSNSAIQSGSLWNLIQLVGEQARRNTVLLMDRDNAEVFYSKVSEVEELFRCLSHHLQHIVSGDQPFTIQMQQASEISKACTILIQAAMKFRDEHQTWYPPPEELMPWNCQPVVRSGLWSIASFIMQFLKEVAVVDMAIKSDLSSQLVGLTDVLLEAYTGCITCKIERGEEHKGLVTEYCKRRDELLRTLYELAKRFADKKYQSSSKVSAATEQPPSPTTTPSSSSKAAPRPGSPPSLNLCHTPDAAADFVVSALEEDARSAQLGDMVIIIPTITLVRNLDTHIAIRLNSFDVQLGDSSSNRLDSCKGIEDLELKATILGEVSSSMLSIAKRHEGYQTLWQICYDLSDTKLLRSLMHDSVGPKGGFSFFVFQQLIKSRQYAELLRLGEEFQEDLASFLKDRNDLLWLHELFLHQFSSASETLHAFALSQDGSAAMVEEQESANIQRRLTLADRKRLLNLSKIAAVAGKAENFETKTRRIEADLQIVKLQEQIVRCCPNSEERGDIDKPLPPVELIELCLKGGGRELALFTFEVFAWTSSSFRSANRSLLEECWKNAADQDDWVALHQRSKLEGWSDEMVLEHLGSTVLFHASNRCYGPEAESYDGDFEEVLPLQREEAEYPLSKDPISSVEEILMQHKDFPDAGKLMLTAIMMGKDGSCVKTEDEEAMECL